MATKVIRGKRYTKHGAKDEAYTHKYAAEVVAKGLRERGYKVVITKEIAKRGPFKGQSLYEVWKRK